MHTSSEKIFLQIYDCVIISYIIENESFTIKFGSDKNAQTLRNRNLSSLFSPFMTLKFQDI